MEKNEYICILFMDLFKGLMIQSITIFCWQSFINPLNLMCSYLKNRKQRVQINYYFRIRRFFSLVQMKKVISMNYGSSTSSWKWCRWVRLDLILSIRDIYINSNLNQNSLAAAKALSLKISSHGKSLKWSQRLSQSAQK